MAISQQEAVQHYSANLHQADQLISLWRQFDAALGQNLARVEAELGAARTALGEAYLVRLNQPLLERAERLTGYRGFSRRDPLKAMAHERVVLENAIRRTEADERWIRRQYLVGPEGEHTRQLAEARSMLEPWQLECDRFEALDGFLELVSIGYDTPEFAESWWEAKYWRHWATGDKICETLELNDFGDDVLPAYQLVKEPRDRWLGEAARVTALIDEVHKLAHSRDAAEARIPQLTELYLESCQRQLGVFFATADLGLLEEWLDADGGDRGVQQVLRRCAGLAAKREFLMEIGQSVQSKQEELARRRAKFSGKITKFQRAKYAHVRLPESVMDTQFGAKRDKYQQQPAALLGQVERLVAYNDYGAFDLQNDPELWWVAMTRKRPSAFNPRLRSWYARNPDAAPALEDDTDLAAAVYTAASTMSQPDRGYLS